jgi:hypothetical protein
VVFFGHNGCQENVTEPVDGLLVEIVSAEIEFEPASEALYSAFELGSV